MTPNAVTSSNSSAFARLFWMGVGPAILAVLAVIIVNQASGWFTLSNLAFLAVLAGMIFARWREFQGDDPRTSTGDPATPADLRRYVLFTTLIGLCIWLSANLVRTYGTAG